MMATLIRTISCIALAAVAGCSEAPEPVAVGTLERDRAELRAPAMEQVSTIAVREGDSIEKGALILSLDNSRSVTVLDQARAQLRAAEARLAEIRRGARQENIDQAQAALAASRSQLAQAKAEWQRIRGLAEENLASGSQRDAAEAAFETAQSTVEQRRAALAELLNGATPEELARIEAERDAAAAAARTAEISVDDLDIRAPFDGRLEQLLVETGDRVPAGMTLATVTRTGAPYADVLLPADERNAIKRDEQRAVMVDDHGCHLARLRYIANEASFTPYYALREEDRGRLVYRAEFELPDSASDLPTGIGVSLLATRECPSP